MSRPFLSMRREHPKIWGEENKHTNMPSTQKDQSFKTRFSISTKRKYPTVVEEENKHLNCSLNPED